jgi:NAD(P)-dependent dehydrogenase (short-subunit alcohol dehydrogenase family)
VVIASELTRGKEMVGKLTGKVALVTGASSGLGKVTAIALAAEGVKRFPLSEVAAAREAQDSGKMMGKAIVEIS